MIQSTNTLNDHQLLEAKALIAVCQNYDGTFRDPYLSNMLNFDPEISAESNAQLMTDALASVGTGLVTFAARSSEFGGKKIKEGDIIALENGKLTITEKSTVKALVKLAKNMVSRDTSFITLIYGEDVTEEEAEKAYEELREKFGSKTDITLVKGDQPVYYFILSVE